jgi:hypothetical protein
MSEDQYKGAVDACTTLARDLHEAARESVEKGMTVAASISNEKTFKFKEWSEIDEIAREGRRMQAAYLLERYFISNKEDIIKRLQFAVSNLLDSTHLKEEDWNKVLVQGAAEGKEGAFESVVNLSPFVFDGKGRLTVWGLISGITDILIGKRLAWCLDSDGYVTNVKWYEPSVPTAAEPEKDQLPLFVREIFNTAKHEVQSTYRFTKETVESYDLVLAGNPANQPNEFWFVEKATDTYKAHISPENRGGWCVRSCPMPSGVWGSVIVVETLLDAIKFLYMYHCLRFK